MLSILKHLFKPHIPSLCPTLREDNDEKHNVPQVYIPNKRHKSEPPVREDWGRAEQLGKKGVSHAYFSVLFPISGA